MTRIADDITPAEWAIDQAISARIDAEDALREKAHELDYVFMVGSEPFRVRPVNRVPTLHVLSLHDHWEPDCEISQEDAEFFFQRAVPYDREKMFEHKLPFLTIEDVEKL